MTWTAPATWAAQVLNSTGLNEQIRDNINHLYNLLKAAPFEFATRRQGNSATDWRLAGTNNYSPTDCFIQCGTATVTLTTSGTNWTATVTLPTALSTTSAIVHVTGKYIAWASSPIFHAYLTSNTQLTIYARSSDPWPGPGSEDITAQWAVVGR